MAGNGPAPKLNRQRRGAPVRGDWVQLEPLTETVLMDLDEIPAPDACEGKWPYTSKLYWEAWQKSPVTAKWTEDDIALAIDTICAHAEAACGGRGAPPAEIRLRMESLGLTPKGRRDNRYLLPEESPPAEVHPLPSAPGGTQVPARSIPEAI